MRKQTARDGSLEGEVVRGYRPGASRGWGLTALWFAMLLVLAAAGAGALFAAAHARQGDQSNGLGLAVVLNAPEKEVLHAVQQVVNDDIIHGTYVYEREKTLTGAVAADASSQYGPWKGPGKAFYKILGGALAPRHFKNSSDIGTISVRYLVQGLKDSKTRVEIEAVFVEDGRRTVHESDGSVESSELREIQDRLQQMHLDEERQAETLRQRKAVEAEEAAAAARLEKEQARLQKAEDSAATIEQRVSVLRHQLVRLVASPGAELKAAPFHAAVSFQNLDPDTEVVILIVTPYWYGVETAGGQRGWVRRDQVKPLP